MGETEDKKFRWNPIYGWFFLRQCESYKVAVEEFTAAAFQDGDEDMLFAMRVFANDRSNEDAASVFDILQSQVTGNALEFAQRWDDPMAAEFLFKSGPEHHGLFLNISMEKPYFKNFLAWYGDIIRFPISPDSENPPIPWLNAVWNYRPALLASNRYAQIQDLAASVEATPNHARLVKTATLAVNLNFSKNMVLEEIEHYLDALYRGAEDRKRIQPAWPELVAVSKLKATNPKWGAEKIGKALSPKGTRDPKEWGRQRLRSIKQVIDFMDRKRPTPTGGRK